MRPENNIFKIIHNNGTPRQGKLLIAEPFLKGMYFERSVVLLAEHDKNASMGFVINKKTTRTLNDYFTSVDLPNPIPIYLGGPVSTNRLFYIHTFGDIIPGSIKIIDGLFFDGDLDILLHHLSTVNDPSTSAKFFIGYSGWGKRQLHCEILADSWIVGKSAHEQIMSASGETFWKQSLSALGGKYEVWSKFPINPRVN